MVTHSNRRTFRKIRVWRDKDEIYRPAVMKSFDVKYNMHKVLSDDGFEAVIDLKLKQWMFDNLSAMPDSSNERLEDENLERSKEKQVSIVSSEEALFSNVLEVELERKATFRRSNKSAKRAPLK
ncbi:hypothetical protein Tco_1438395 [Tanacetum coccineum]